MNGMPMDLQENVSHERAVCTATLAAIAVCSCLVLYDHQTQPSAPAAPLQSLCNGPAAADDHAQCVGELHGPQGSSVPIAFAGP